MDRAGIEPATPGFSGSLFSQSPNRNEGGGGRTRNHRIDRTVEDTIAWPKTALQRKSVQAMGLIGPMSPMRPVSPISPRTAEELGGGRGYTSDMDARPLLPLSPLEETVRSLPAWPEWDLFCLARAVGTEISRRQLPTPVALPVVEILGSSLFELRS
jgi:hypothetical protein